MIFMKRSRLGRASRFRLLHEVEIGRKLPEVIITKADLKMIAQDLKGKNVIEVIYPLEGVKHG